jgi:hypothetical protein
MTCDSAQFRQYFDRAYEMAYYIHADKDIAVFIAEDALDDLPTLLGYQAKSRIAPTGLRGFLKWGERSRPVRKTLTLIEDQMLQWLVYKHSEPWERQTEAGTGFYLPTEEDLIVRYVEHLVYSTLRRGSFYVALAIGPLLHGFDRRETRLFYDVLTQGDSARMKDTSYIGKQRLQLLDGIVRRFGHMIQTEKRPGGEKHIVMRQTTDWVISLVHSCLRRFVPWDTPCVVEPGFEVTDAKGLYFPTSDLVEEDRTEVNRVHTLLHPECFAHFVDGLAKLVRALPRGHEDRACNYGSVAERIAVPQFSNFPKGPPRSDRLEAPQLTERDRVRLQRMMQARGRRRRDFKPANLRVYVDNVLLQSIDLSRESRIEVQLPADAAAIEVKGGDGLGEITLAILPVSLDLIPISGKFKDSVLQIGRRELEIQMAPIRDAGGIVECAEVTVSYSDHRKTPGVLSLIPRALRVSSGWTSTAFDVMRERWTATKAGDPLTRRAGWLAVILVISALAFVWLRLQPTRQKPVIDQTATPPAGEREISPPPTSPRPEPQPSTAQGRPTPPPARASWSYDPRAVLRAVRIEPTRAETATLGFSGGQTTVYVKLPLYDDIGQRYLNYNLLLSAGEKTLWRRTLESPRITAAGQGPILKLVLSSKSLPHMDTLNLRVDGSRKAGLHPLGEVSLHREDR